MTKLIYTVQQDCSETLESKANSKQMGTRDSSIHGKHKRKDYAEQTLGDELNAFGCDWTQCCVQCNITEIIQIVNESSAY